MRTHRSSGGTGFREFDGLTERQACRKARAMGIMVKTLKEFRKFVKYCREDEP